MPWTHQLITGVGLGPVILPFERHARAVVRLGHRGTPSIDVSDENAILAARPIASLPWREMDSNFQYASIARWHRATDLPAARSQRPVPISPSTSLSITWCDASFYSISPADSTRTGFSARPRRRPGSTRTTTSTKKVMSARSRRSSPNRVAGIRTCHRSYTSASSGA